jgi:hypothetical protein
MGATGALDLQELLISGSRPTRLRTLETCRCQKSGATGYHPTTALLIRGSNLTIEGFEQVPQIARVRDDEGAHIRAYPRAHRLEGAPHVVFESQRGQLVGGIPSRESFRTLGP